MKKSLRLTLLAGASFIGLAFAVPALAAFNPSLTVEQTSYKLAAATTVDFFAFVPQDDDPTAKMTFFSPSGYSSNLTAAPGTKIGKVVAFVKAKLLGGAVLPLAGDVVVANPADPAIQAAAMRCTGTTTNQTNWVLNTSLQGTTVAIPVFVNKVGPLTTLQVCLPPPDVPVSSGGAQFGAQLVSADFSVNGIFTNAAAKGGYEWSGIFTPYVPGGGTVNVAGTVEWRTFVGLPASLTLARGKIVAMLGAKKKGVTLNGKFSVQELNSAGIRLRLYYGKKNNPAPNATGGGDPKAKIARTGKLPSSGKFSVFRPLPTVVTYFQARFENYGTTCVGPSPSGLPVPCKGEDLAPLTSNSVKVVPPKKKHK